MGGPGRWSGLGQQGWPRWVGVGGAAAGCSRAGPGGWAWLWGGTPLVPLRCGPHGWDSALRSPFTAAATARPAGRRCWGAGSSCGEVCVHPPLPLCQPPTPPTPQTQTQPNSTPLPPCPCLLQRQWEQHYTPLVLHTCQLVELLLAAGCPTVPRLVLRATQAPLSRPVASGATVLELPWWCCRALRCAGGGACADVQVGGAALVALPGAQVGWGWGLCLWVGVVGWHFGQGVVGVGWGLGVADKVCVRGAQKGWGMGHPCGEACEVPLICEHALALLVVRPPVAGCIRCAALHGAPLDWEAVLAAVTCPCPPPAPTQFPAAVGRRRGVVARGARRLPARLPPGRPPAAAYQRAPRLWRRCPAVAGRAIPRAGPGCPAAPCLGAAAAAVCGRGRVRPAGGASTELPGLSCTRELGQVCTECVAEWGCL